ncbi:MAG: hypothetical protein KDA44_09390 [Planctomycetales bacterium]|nr:hypothetical protein [Planctomycetales bacterium]
MLAIVSEARRPVCFARSMLTAAASDVKRGSLIAAACRLREAVRQYLAAMCEAFDCLPAKRCRRTPAGMLLALAKVDAIDEGTAQWVGEIIAVCNAAAHCETVRPSLIATGVYLFGLVLDCADDDLHLPAGRKGGAA